MTLKEYFKLNKLKLKDMDQYVLVSPDLHWVIPLSKTGIGFKGYSENSMVGAINSGRLQLVKFNNKLYSCVGKDGRYEYRYFTLEHLAQKEKYRIVLVAGKSETYLHVPYKMYSAACKYFPYNVSKMSLKEGHNEYDKAQSYHYDGLF